MPYCLAADTLGAAEISAAKDVLDSGRLTMGPRVRQFEDEFAAWVGTGHAVMVNSGSSANLLVVDALLRGATGSPQLAMGDEIIVPGLAWSTTAWPIAQLGMVPVFADVDPGTLAIDLQSAQSVIGPRTRALFLIHALGRAADLNRYRQFCDDNGLILIEDCCESLGAHSDGRHVGTAGVASSFSFYFSHHISTIEGGMVATDNPALADDLRSLRAHGWARDRADKEKWISSFPSFDPRFLFISMGYNVRPTELQGAIGSIQLRRLDEMLRAREDLAARVVTRIAASAPWLELIGSETLFGSPSPERRARSHSWMTLPLRVKAGAPVARDAVVARLESMGVETRPVIAGNLARHPALQRVDHRVASAMTACDALLTDAFMIGCHPVIDASSLSTLDRALDSLADL
jgi:CDP-6-deoxy-D-xylo-4-hexulose-3-dehydrase